VSAAEGGADADAGSDGGGEGSAVGMGARASEDEAMGGRETPAAGYDRRTTVIARSVVRLVVPIILVTAVALLLQGHNLPGGGFIGAVLTATAFVLVYVVFGLSFLREVLVGEADADGAGVVAAYRFVFAFGLALAAGSGLVPVAFDRPFLTQGVLFVDGLPLYGTLEVASALAFDVGVYLAVVGALLAVVAEVGAE
jgi:multicomponent Na+:H+ antiporter subunit B